MNLVDWFYPRICVGCGREGEYICRECSTKLMKPPAICPMCCEPSQGGWTHQRCKRPMGIDRLVVGLPYKGPVQKALKQAKYKSAWDVVDRTAEIWTERIGDQLRIEKGVEVWVAAVPMYKKKANERGYNQAERIARKLAAELNKDGADCRYVELLTRKKETLPMFGLSKRERKDNVSGAFEMSGQQTVYGVQQTRVRVTMLVDDVWTTGATMRECTKVLKRSGKKTVWALTIAR